MLNKKDRIKKISDAHQGYVDWWLPIDVQSGSLLAPMGLWMFCMTLLTYDTEKWFDRWVDGFTKKDVFELAFMLHNDYEGTMELIK